MVGVIEKNLKISFMELCQHEKRLQKHKTVNINRVLLKGFIIRNMKYLNIGSGYF